MEVLLYFILPIKMKWMAFVYVAMALYYFFTGSLATKVAIAASLLNFVIFFLSSRNMKRFSPKEQARKAKFKQQIRDHISLMRMGQDTVVQSADVQNLMIRHWSSVSVQNVMETMSIARIIYLHMNM